MKQLFVAPIVAIASLSYWSPVPASEPTTTKHLSVATSTSTPSVAPGGRVALVVEVTPKPNMHVYAPGQPDVIPISLTLKAADAKIAQPVQFPPAEKLEVKELGETQLVYSRPFRLVQDVAVPSSPSLVKRAASPDASLTFNGVLKYQACDNTICYAPVSVPVTWTVALKAETPQAVKKPR